MKLQHDGLIEILLAPFIVLGMAAMFFALAWWEIRGAQ